MFRLLLLLILIAQSALANQQKPNMTVIRCDGVVTREEFDASIK